MDSDPEPAPKFMRDAGVTGASELCDAVVVDGVAFVGGVAMGVVVAESVSMKELSFDPGLEGAGD